jgi:hypothetical protein
MCVTMLLECTATLNRLVKSLQAVDKHWLMPELCTDLCFDRIAKAKRLAREVFPPGRIASAFSEASRQIAYE